MASYDDVLVRGARSLDEVARLVADVTGVAGRPWGEGLAFPVGDSVVHVYTADLEDEQGRPLSQYDYDVDTYGPRQVDLAKRMFEELSRRTDWDLMLLTDDLGRVVDQRHLVRA